MIYITGIQCIGGQKRKRYVKMMELTPGHLEQALVTTCSLLNYVLIHHL